MDKHDGAFKLAAKSRFHADQPEGVKRYPGQACQVQLCIIKNSSKGSLRLTGKPATYQDFQ
eukprot:scaffold183782_cov13-Tisochrysis_lutea.AAC.1